MDADEQKKLNQKIRGYIAELTSLVEELDDGSQRTSIVDAASNLMDALRKPVANRSTAAPPAQTVRVTIPLPRTADERAVPVPVVNLIEAQEGEPLSDAQPIPGARAARIRSEANKKSDRDNK